jgi:hypothetical protein
MRKNLSPLTNHLRLFFAFAFLVSAAQKTYSQTVRYDSLNKQKFVLVDVQKTYERIASKGYESIEIYEYLGNYYYENNNPRKSKLYFDKLFNKYNLSQISAKSLERYLLMSNQISTNSH